MSDILRRHQQFPRQMTSEERKKNFCTLFSDVISRGSLFGEISAVFLGYIKGSICTLKFSFLELSYNYKSSEKLLKPSY